MPKNIIRQIPKITLPPGPVVSRFAPAPTGYLHLGHVVSCLYVYGITRALGGQVLVRIEDHDQTRSRPTFDDAIRDDLVWLGLVPDRSPWPNLGQYDPSLRQSHRAGTTGIYNARLAELTARGLTYRCDCSRSSMALNPDGEIFHDGLCKTRDVPATAPHGIRLLMPDREFTFKNLTQITTKAADEAHNQNPQLQSGDLLVRDRNGCFTYQFCCAVDDLDQGVNLIIRGADLLTSTGRQLALRQMLIPPQNPPAPPIFFHHPLLTDGSGQKLGKRFLSESIRQLRMDGQTPEAVLGLAAFLAEKIDRQASLDLASALKMFAQNMFVLNTPGE